MSTFSFEIHPEKRKPKTSNPKTFQIRIGFFFFLKKSVKLFLDQRPVKHDYRNIILCDNREQNEQTS